MAETQKKSYSDTVHLPKTAFPMRGDLPQREPGWLALWEEKGVYQRMQEKAKGRPPFTLHDGPPYANGHTHIGHALNKVLKDMTVKSQALMGRLAAYVPGWDCHGLPIEHALLKEKKMSKRGVADVNLFRAEARAFAQRWIDVQRDEFRRMGVLGDWSNPYKTMSNEYEAAVINAFRRLYAKGYITRGLKSVTWCVTCETALAEAEVEYKDKTSPSVYVALPIKSWKGALPFEGPGSVLVWTTTPWTLPANLAVAFHPELVYCFTEARLKDGRTAVFLAAEARVGAILKALGAERTRAFGMPGGLTGARIVGEFGLVCEAPFAYLEGFRRKESKAVLADYVTAEDGTGIVHTAPGHGVDDFHTGVKNGLEALCPVDGAGRFTEEAPTPLRGKKIFEEGNPAVAALLSERGALWAQENVSHSYPHCWRCKNPIAFRATEQWFLGVSHEGLRERLSKAIKDVSWHPPAGQARISAMVGNRPDWCLSRQRLWGTPIPMLRCRACKAYVGDGATLEALERKVAAEGSDFWFADPGRPVDAESWPFLPPSAKCPKCSKGSFERETDILDVWMDSGASWLAVLSPQGRYPCDLYLEGSDQHRGWFQSSLVLSTALEGKAPFGAVLTHGFVLDDKGRAMHKSSGNVVAPQEVIGKYGADVLRLWVALADYSDDVRISDKLLEGPTETYRKIRNTLRYLLGNVCDYDPARHAVAYDAMPELERYLLGRLYALDRDVCSAYESFAFRGAATAIVDFCNLDLSAFYLDARKDALYTLKRDDPVRRAAQRVMWECLTRLLGLAAPVLSFTCEEAWQEVRASLKAQGSPWRAEESVFLQDFPPIPAAWMSAELAERWALILRVREAALKSLEEARARKLIGAPLQARLILQGDEAGREFLAAVGAERWAELCIVSEAQIAPIEAGGDAAAAQLPHRLGKVQARVEKAAGLKCPRCWRYRADGGRSASDPELCARCASQLGA